MNGFMELVCISSRNHENGLLNMFVVVRVNITFSYLDFMLMLK